MFVVSKLLSAITQPLFWLALWWLLALLLLGKKPRAAKRMLWSGLVLLGVLVATAGHYGGEVFPYLLLLNPTDVFRILNVFSTEDVRSAYGLTSTVPPLLAHPGVLTGVMLAWIALPLALANWRFKP